MQIKQLQIDSKVVLISTRGRKSKALKRLQPSKPAVKPKVVYTGLKIHIRPSMLVVLPQFSGVTRDRSASQRATEVNLAQNKTQGDVSKKAQSRISNAVNWLALSAQKKRVYHKASSKWFEYKLGLFTLTLPDTSKPVTASFFKEQLLQPWLAYARKYFALQNYVWKIEPQENNKVHVHITSDTFIHHTDLRRAWNNQLRRHGLLDDFVCKFGHDNPPTEQAAAVKSVKDMAAYLAKYMVKGEAHVSQILLMEDTTPDVICIRKDTTTYKRNVANFKKIWFDSGRLWGCNYELSNASTKFCEAEAQNENEVMFSLMHDSIKVKPLLGEMQSNGFRKCFGYIYFLKARNWLNHIHGPLKERFVEIINFLRDHIPPENNLFYQYCPMKYSLS